MRDGAMMLRCLDPSWILCALNDPSGRRGIWFRELAEPTRATDGIGVIELCGGREGDDAFVRLELPRREFLALGDVMTRAAWMCDEAGLERTKATMRQCGVTDEDWWAAHPRIAAAVEVACEWLREADQLDKGEKEEAVDACFAMGDPSAIGGDMAIALLLATYAQSFYPSEATWPHRSAYRDRVLALTPDLGGSW